MMNKPAIYEKMLKSFFDRYTKVVSTLRAHLAAGQRDDARREAHSLKGVAASLGANDLARAALAVERAIAGGQVEIAAEISAMSQQLEFVLDGLRQHFGWHES